MNKIICPHCKKAFEIDEAGFADIIKQVRDQEFNKDLKERERIFIEDKENAIKLAEANITNTLQKDLVKKEVELAELKAKKEAELAEMKSKINNAELEKNLQSLKQSILLKKNVIVSQLNSIAKTLKIDFLYLHKKKNTRVS